VAVEDVELFDQSGEGVSGDRVGDGVVDVVDDGVGLRVLPDQPEVEGSGVGIGNRELEDLRITLNSDAEILDLIDGIGVGIIRIGHLHGDHHIAIATRIHMIYLHPVIITSIQGDGIGGHGRRISHIVVVCGL
jgi:hypothetical protein